ncbi:site-specific tyrosine recombinase/integron integrase [Salegentibacter sp. HM20]
MKKVILECLRHRGSQIAIKFGYDEEIKAHVKKFPGVTWTKTHTCFYVNFSAERLQQLVKHLRTGGLLVEISSEFRSIKAHQEKGTSGQVSVLTSEKKALLKQYEKYLFGIRYSPSTIRTYTNFIQKFLLKLNKEVRNINNRDLEIFCETEIAGKDYAISTHRQAVSALKHFIDLHRIDGVSIETIKRPRKDRALPVILSKEEIIDLLRVTRNLKHRVILALLYSSGLRIGEVLSLKLNDIDIDRRQILIRRAKGRKDRVVGMAESFIPLLWNYINTFEPKTLFIEGVEGKAYSASSVRSFLKESCRRAGIKKRVTPHTLRHTYATHMLENGIDLRHIQMLLGHSKPETTMIYTQVSQKDLVKIRSPLDVTLRELAQTDNKQENPRLSRNIFD